MYIGLPNIRPARSGATFGQSTAENRPRSIEGRRAGEAAEEAAVAFCLVRRRSQVVMLGQTVDGSELEGVSPKAGEGLQDCRVGPRVGKGHLG